MLIKGGKLSIGPQDARGLVLLPPEERLGERGWGEEVKPRDEVTSERTHHLPANMHVRVAKSQEALR